MRFFIALLVLVVSSTYASGWESLSAWESFDRIPKQFPKSQRRHATIEVEQDPLRIAKDPRVLMPCLRGIVLGACEEDIVDLEVEGILATDLALPGPFEKLKSTLAPFLGKKITEADLIEIKRCILLFYRNYHHPIVYVYIPQQEISSGVVRFVVLEGMVGEINIKGCRYFRDSHIRNQIRLKQGCSIDTAQLADDLDWINRNPFRRVDAVFSPSKFEGYTDLNFLVSDVRPFLVYAGVDNTGLKHTGNTRWFTGFNWGNVWGLAHQLFYQFTTASSYSNFWSHSLHYVVPFRWRHEATLFGGYSRVKGKLIQQEPLDKIFAILRSNGIDPETVDIEDIKALVTFGYSTQASFRYQIPFRTDSLLSQEWVSGFDFKRTNTNISFEGTLVTMPKDSVNLTQIMLGYTLGFDLRWMRYFLMGELFVSPGEWLPDQSNKNYQEIRPDAKNQYLYGRFALESTFCLPLSFTFDTVFKVQLSTANLLASEQFGLGGYNTVRGYPERIVNTDNAILMNLVLKTPHLSLYRLTDKLKRNPGDCLSLIGFFDLGYGYDHIKPPPAPPRKNAEGELCNDSTSGSALIMGIGPGIRYFIGNGLVFRGDLGFKLKNLEGDTSSPYKFHFGLTATF